MAGYRFLDENLTTHGIISEGLSEIRHDIIFLKHGIKMDKATTDYVDEIIKKTKALEMTYNGSNENTIRKVLSLFDRK